MKTYLFYDLETTGRNKCFDQVLQFAAIRTDVELRELERHEIQIKLNSDVIPDPQAILIHRIPLSQMRQGETEIAALKKIHALVNTPGTISCGYNTLGFDDEFLRFGFYRNLLTPYTHQWANDCGRMDLLPMTICYYLYKNSVLRWPQVDGKPSMKLEHLSRENHLAQGMAHNALVDVEATLALARLFIRERQMWDYLLGYFNKQTDLERVQQLTPTINTEQGPRRIGLMIGETGPKDFYQFPVLELGNHYHYSNQSLWLRLDTPALTKVTPDTIAEATWTARKKAGEPGLILPCIDRFQKYLTMERRKIMQENLKLLQTKPHLLSAIQAYHCDYTYPKFPNVDIDAALYESGFLSPEEQKLCEHFHAATVTDKIKLLAGCSNPQIQKIGYRILGRHYYEYLDAAGQAQFNAYLDTVYFESADNPINYRGEKRLSVSEAVDEIAALIAAGKLDPADLQLLKELNHYLNNKLILEKFAWHS